MADSDSELIPSPDHQLVPVKPSAGRLRSLWTAYQNAKWVWHVVVPFGLGGFAGYALSWAWTMLDRSEYGAAMLLVLLFLVLGIGASIAIVKRLLRVIAVTLVVLVAGFSGLKVLQEKGDKPWTALFKENRKVPIAPSQSAESLYLIQAGPMFTDRQGVNHEVGTVPIWWMVSADDGRLFPINKIMFLRIVSRQPTVSRIDTYGVEMQVGPDQWVKLSRIRKGRVYYLRKSFDQCQGFQDAREFYFERGFFDDALAKNIQSGETIEGWVFLQIPEINVSRDFRPAYKLNITQTSGAKFSGIIPYPEAVRTEQAVDRYLLRAGQLRDLTELAEKSYGDLVKLTMRVRRAKGSKRKPEPCSKQDENDPAISLDR